MDRKQKLEGTSEKYGWHMSGQKVRCLQKVGWPCFTCPCPPTPSSPDPVSLAPPGHEASGEGKVSQVEVQDPNGSLTLSR